MSLAIVHSRALAGITAPLVIVEVHLSSGLPGLSIVGLPETAVKESRHRVRSAIINGQFEFPARRITVNLAPADLPKEGGRFDLAIALGILAASQQIPREPLDQYEFAAELALSGQLRGIKGALPFAIATAQAGRQLIIAADNASEAALAENVAVYAAKHMLDVCAHLCATQTLPAAAPHQQTLHLDYPDLCEVKGQVHGKRALEIAAAGGHSLLLIGPPGTGKTMLATRLTGILPSLSHTEALSVAAVYSLGDKGYEDNQWRIRPLRAPHHSASSVAMVGGGNPPRPGEISLAHYGVLFLDELPEFSRSVLESLREPLEAGTVVISRAAQQAEFPARFQLIAAMNPCPCGYASDHSGRCHCTSEQIQRYWARLSGPLLDRIDMHVDIPALPLTALLNTDSLQTEASDVVRQRVTQARSKQQARSSKLNAHLTNAQVERLCQLTATEHTFLAHTIERLGLSARAYYRVLKLARTIADLAGDTVISQSHLQEALGYRRRGQTIPHNKLRPLQTKFR